MAKYFYDTYALTEYTSGNKKYKKYFQEHKGITTKLNLMELYYAFLKYTDKEKAGLIYNSFLPLTVEVEDNIIKNAMQLRLKLKQQKRNISYVDAIGYQIAKEQGIKFLTGDKEFKDLKNVEFVK